MRFTLTTLATLLVSALANAVDDVHINLDYNPAVTSPTTGDVWTAGQSYNVTWVRPETECGSAS